MDDMLSILKPVLRHRIIPNFNAEAEGIRSDDILDNLLEKYKNNFESRISKIFITIRSKKN